MIAIWEADGDFSLAVQTLTIVKAGGPLGLSIVGGQGHTSHPFGIDNPGVFISKVNTDLYTSHIVNHIDHIASNITWPSYV